MSEENTLSVFKSYLRLLLENLKNIKEANENGDKEKVAEILERLIKDTQSGIEDNG